MFGVQNNDNLILVKSQDHIKTFSKLYTFPCSSQSLLGLKLKKYREKKLNGDFFVWELIKQDFTRENNNNFCHL